MDNKAFMVSFDGGDFWWLWHGYIPKRVVYTLSNILLVDYAVKTRSLLKFENQEVYAIWESIQEEINNRRFVGTYHGN
jgi:hypothetical protein